MDLYYEIKGHGHPVVLIHSGGADLRDWTYVSPLLATDYKVIAFDGRGAGKSPDPKEDVNCVEDLKSLLDHLKISAATIVGHSMGGQIATDFALEYPEKVSELILIAPSLTGFNYSKEFLSYMNKVTEAAPDIDKMIEVSQSAPSYRVVQSSQHRELVENMLRHHIKRLFQWSDFEFIWPVPLAAERLGELTNKTLFIIGTEELPDNVRVADYFRQHSNARIIKIPGADHMSTLTHPKELTRLITAFMEGDNDTQEENERIRQRSKEKILAAAMELFIKKGYHATSISDVALQASISKGLLYNYFQGKEQLILKYLGIFFYPRC